MTSTWPQKKSLLILYSKANNVPIQYPPSKIKSSRFSIRENNRKNNDQAGTLKEDLAPQLQRCMELNQEKSASQWLNAIPPGLTRVGSPQRSISGCALFQVWMASQASPLPLSLREDLFL